jgi:hypothetical protein
MTGENDMTTEPKSGCPMHSPTAEVPAADAPAPYNPASDGAQMSFDGRMSYGDYLHIDQILTAQRLLTPVRIVDEAGAARTGCRPPRRR